jgi:hypothetical protein
MVPRCTQYKKLVHKGLENSYDKNLKTEGNTRGVGSLDVDLEMRGGYDWLLV